MSKRSEPDQDRQKWISIEDLETLYRTGTYLSRVHFKSGFGATVPVIKVTLQRHIRRFQISLNF